MAFQDGLRLRLIIDGVQQVTQSEVSVKFDPQNNPLDTLEGLAGKTPGSGKATITGTQVVPIGGLEFDFIKANTDGSYHDLQIPIGGKAYIGNGWFDDVTVSQSTGKGTEVQFSWTGEFKPLR